MTQKDAKTAGPFVLKMPGQLWWTVKVPVPVDGDYELAELPVLFMPVPQARLDRFRGIGLEEGDVLPTEADICREVVAGFRAKDEAGEPVPSTPESLAELLNVPVVRASIVATYLAVMNGMGARKNA